MANISSAATGEITVPATGVAFIYAYGAGGEGSIWNTAGGGGGGGGACFKRHPVVAGTKLAYTVPAGIVNGGTGPGQDGGDTVVTAPGLRMVAGGGRGGANGELAAGGLGGRSYGGDINRTGGNGGQAGTGSAGGQAGAMGEFGAAGGAGHLQYGGGGGSAGFSDLLGMPAGSGGVSTAVAGTPGGGSGAEIQAPVGASGGGRLLVFFWSE